MDLDDIFGVDSMCSENKLIKFLTSSACSHLRENFHWPEGKFQNFYERLYRLTSNYQIWRDNLSTDGLDFPDTHPGSSPC